MTEQSIYLFICYGSAILAALMFIITVVLFFVLKIPHVIGDLTGSNARKAIENIRNQNESTGEKVYKSSETNIKRGKVTDKITPSGNLIKNPSENIAGAMQTEKIGQDAIGSNETTVLGSAAETTVLNAPAAETTVLNTVSQETTVLNTNQMASAAIEQPAFFAVEYEITYIHTSEVITL